MYKILHKLFGWDYIQWRNTADRGIARVFIAKDKRVYYWRYKNTKLLDLITNPKHVIWLTCSPTKYFNEE